MFCYVIPTYDVNYRFSMSLAGISLTVVPSSRFLCSVHCYGDKQHKKVSAVPLYCTLQYVGPAIDMYAVKRRVFCFLHRL